MKNYFIIIILMTSLTGCVSEDTIELSKGVAAFENQQYMDILKIIEDEAVIAKYPQLTGKIKRNGSGLVRATKALWLLLEGNEKDDVIE